MALNDPRVSVIMSVYNGERFLREAIESIEAQTYQDWEFIIVDDGSTDGTSKILESFAADSRIRVISQENCGLAPSLNRAISLARGEYIARQDADDVSLAERLERQVVFLDERPGVGLVGCWTDWMDEAGEILMVFEYPTDNITIQQQLLEQNCFTHGAVMMRKTAFHAVGGYCEQFLLAQDYELWLRFSENYEVANLPLMLYRYRKTLDGISCRLYETRAGYKELAKRLARERRDGPLQSTQFDATTSSLR